MTNNQFKDYLPREQLLDIIGLLTTIVQQGLDLKSIMRLVTTEAIKLTNSDGAVIELVEDGFLVYTDVSGLAEHQIGLKVPINNSLSGLAIQTGQTLVCLDSELDKYVNIDACRTIGLRSMIVTPLKNGDQNVGVLKVLYIKPNAFSNREIAIVELMSDLIAALMYTAIKFSMDELYLKATTDQLTGISNRALFFDRLKRILSESRRTGDIFSIAIFDMDRLKSINDKQGHRTADAAIREISRRAKESIREYDTISRLGGDEFGLILYKTKTLKDAENLCSRLVSLISEPFFYENKQLQLGISIGCSIFPDDGDTIDELLETADSRMYENKLSKQ